MKDAEEQREQQIKRNAARRAASERRKRERRGYFARLNLSIRELRKPVNCDHLNRTTIEFHDDEINGVADDGEVMERCTNARCRQLFEVQA